MSWKDRIEKELKNLEDLSNQISIIGNITFLLKEDAIVNDETIRQLSESDDPLIHSLCSFLKWKQTKDFSKIEEFFSSLRSAITKYANYDNLNTALLELFIEKRIQFNLYDELVKDLSNLEPYLSKTLDYKLVIEQERVLKAFSKAFIILYSKQKIDKTSQIGLTIYELCIKLEEKYRNAKRYDLERDFLGLRIEINKILNQSDGNIVKSRIAESFENEGDDYEVKGKGLGLSSYSYGFMNYLDFGEKRKLESVKNKIKNSVKATKNSLKSIPISNFEIKIDEVIKDIIPKIKYDNVLKSLTSSSLLYPKKYTPTDEEVGIGIKLMPYIVIDDYDNVSAILEWDENKQETKDEFKKYRAFTLLKIEEAKFSYIRLKLFRHLIENNLLSKDDIFRLIDSSPIDTNLKELLKFGTTKHFEGDFISSSYTLTLQIEPLIVSLVRNKTNLIAISHKPNRRGATQETTLGTLLSYPEVKNLFDENFYDLLELYFTYDLGLNYRNEIAHGLVNHNKLTEEYSLTVIFLICRILFMLK